MMNLQALEGQWNQVRGELKKKWGQLTENDLRFNNGNIDQLIGRIQSRTGAARETIERFLDEVTARGAEAVSGGAERFGQYARQAGNQLREGYERISDQLGRGCDYSQEMFRENPTRSIAAVFGVGVLLGVVVGMALHRR
jgi:uncharacterized protein YjbJ (UPF0337 family)